MPSGRRDRSRRQAFVAGLLTGALPFLCWQAVRLLPPTGRDRPPSPALAVTRPGQLPSGGRLIAWTGPVSTGGGGPPLAEPRPPSRGAAGAPVGVAWAGVRTASTAAGAPAAASGATPPASTTGASDPFAPLEQAFTIITQNYAGTVDQQALIQGALTGMVNALEDPFSQYLPPAADSSFLSSLSGFGGIGVAIDATPAGPVINSVEAGGPAYTAGLRSGDLIVSVDGHSTVGASLAQVADWLRGAPGTQVTVQVKGPSSPQPVQYQLTRVEIVTPSVFASSPSPGIGLIRITSFTSTTAQEFDAAYRGLQQQMAASGGLKGLILDLRGNGGGFVSAALHIAQELAPPGPLFDLVAASGKVTQYTAPAHPPAPPMVVLVDSGTASAAEILAGALQYTRAALLVGTRTYGKGSVQEIFPLPGGGGLKLTIAHDTLPDGVSWDHVGLQPNVLAEPLPPPWSQVPDFAPVGSRALHRGMVGMDVLGLQQRLAFLGYKPGPQSGVYGNRTLVAVGVFQRDQGLPVTGQMGPADWTALNRAVAARVLALRNAPQPDVVLQKALQVMREYLRVGS